MPLLTILNYISQASVLIPVIAGWIYYKKLTQPFRFFFWFFVLSIGFEIVGRLTTIIYHNNMPGLYVFNLVEFLAFSRMYYLHFQKNSKMRLLIAVNAVVFVGIAIADAFYISDIMKPPIISRSYASAFILIYTLISLFSLFQKEDLHYSWEYPMFWVCIGALVYFGTNTLYFMLMSQLLLKAPDIEKWSYHAHAAFNIIGNCLFAQSFRRFNKWTGNS